MRVRRHPRTPPLSVASLMKPGVPTVGRAERLVDVAARMRRDAVGAVAVMDGDELAGIVTERDLLCAVAEGLDPKVTPVSASMTPGPRTIEASAAAAEAAETMIELGVRHLPVLQDSRVAGIISARDLLQLTRPTPLDVLASEPW